MSALSIIVVMEGIETPVVISEKQRRTVTYPQPGASRRTNQQCLTGEGGVHSRYAAAAVAAFEGNLVNECSALFYEGMDIPQP